MAHGAASDTVPRVALWADRDDDDADGRPDGQQPELRAAARVDLVAVDPRWTSRRWVAVTGGEHARVVTEAGPLPWGRIVPAHAWLQGISPGTVEVSFGDDAPAYRLRIDVRDVEWRSSSGDGIDPTLSHVSLDRTPPARLDSGPASRELEGGREAPPTSMGEREGGREAPPSSVQNDDPDSVRVVVSLRGDPLPSDSPHSASLESLGAFGAWLGTLPLVLSPATCGADGGTNCWTSAPVRLVVDTVDRDAPVASERSLLAQVGGALVLRWNGHKAQMIRVLGPRATAAGPIDRFRATLRPFVVRLTPGGAPAIGGTDAEAVHAMRSELTWAAAIWGQCGVTFGDERTWRIGVVDPPPSHLVSIGEDLGFPASGGTLSFRVGARRISLATFPGERVDRVARELVRTAERAGLNAIALPNARIGPGVESSIDISLRRRDGSLAGADIIPGVALSTDATLSVRIGSVDLADGLDHFSDTNAVAGTLEERTLVKAFDDGDPTTIEVFVVPLFSGSGRLGESFIGSDLSSLRNVVLLDGAGVRAKSSSYTLPHELGHVLMDLPGHPDDYASDTPTNLMDSDASDASAFGPRRLSLDDCARVVRQSGPGARVPLLAAWPIGPLQVSKTALR